MQAAKCTNHYDNKNLIQLCNKNKKNVLSERSKPQTHFVNLEAIPSSVVPYISKEKINPHSHFYITTTTNTYGSTVFMKKKLKAFTVKATRLQQRLLLIRDISANVSASKTLGRSVPTCVCVKSEEQGTRLALKDSEHSFACSLQETKPFACFRSLVGQGFHRLLHHLWFPRI